PNFPTQINGRENNCPNDSIQPWSIAATCINENLFLFHKWVWFVSIVSISIPSTWFCVFGKRSSFKGSQKMFYEARNKVTIQHLFIVMASAVVFPVKATKVAPTNLIFLGS
ncbi:MAG: hypothetical protein ACI85U_002303, partial [Candidatus Promineifilaceae bacterium]